MHRAIANMDTQQRRYIFSNNFNIEGRCRGSVKVQNRLLRRIGLHLAFITMDDAKQSLAQLLFHQAGDVPADLATAIALVNDEIVPMLVIQRRAGQALFFHVRQGRHRGGIRQQRDQMQVRQTRQRL